MIPLLEISIILFLYTLLQCVQVVGLQLSEDLNIACDSNINNWYVRLFHYSF